MQELARGAPWNAASLIRPENGRVKSKTGWEYDQDGQRRAEVGELDFGPLLTDKKHVEPMLRRGQAECTKATDVPCGLRDGATGVDTV